MKQIVTAQYQDIVNRAAKAVRGLSMPSEGWLRTVRKSLGMSGAQLARRMGVTRGLISNTEKAELSGGVTIKAMQQMAEALDCRFVYAIVPEDEIEELIERRAQEKAQVIVEKAGEQMALEAQGLSAAQLKFEKERLARDMVRDLPSDLWNDP